MNWNAIGAIREILGAVGVIISLVYLAGQIRGNRQAFSPRFRALYATLQPETSFKRVGGELGLQAPS